MPQERKNLAKASRVFCRKRYVFCCYVPCLLLLCVIFVVPHKPATINKIKEGEYLEFVDEAAEYAGSLMTKGGSEKAKQLSAEYSRRVREVYSQFKVDPLDPQTRKAEVTRLLESFKASWDHLNANAPHETELEPTAASETQRRAEPKPAGPPPQIVFFSAAGSAPKLKLPELKVDMATQPPLPTPPPTPAATPSPTPPVTAAAAQAVTASVTTAQPTLATAVATKPAATPGSGSGIGSSAPPAGQPPRASLGLPPHGKKPPTGPGPEALVSPLAPPTGPGFATAATATGAATQPLVQPLGGLEAAKPPATMMAAGGSGGGVSGKASTVLAKVTGMMYQVLRFTVLKRRSGEGVQISDLVFYNNGAEVGMKDCNAFAPETSSPRGEEVKNLFDGDPTTKWFEPSYQGGGAGQQIIVDCPSPRQMTHYTYVTGNDDPSRDPIQWTLEAGEGPRALGGTIYKVVHRTNGDTVVPVSRSAAIQPPFDLPHS